MTVGLTSEYITPTKTDTWLVLQQSAVKTIAEDIFVSPRRITHLTLTRRQENISTFGSVSPPGATGRLHAARSTKSDHATTCLEAFCEDESLHGLDDVIGDKDSRLRMSWGREGKVREGVGGQLR